ncbi:MAG: hypothetical protein AAGF12_00025 [Myxococcota bacterium]
MVSEHRSSVWTLALLAGVWVGCTEKMPAAESGVPEAGAEVDGEVDGGVPAPDATVQPDALDSRPSPSPAYDRYLPQLTADECAFDEPFESALAESEFRRRDVCDAGCEFSSLADAIAAAEPYDDIRLAPGLHSACIDTSVSPLIIQGDGDLAVIESSCADPDAEVLTFGSEFLVLRNLHLRGDIEAVAPLGTGVRLGSRLVEARLHRVWIEGFGTAISGTSNGRLWLDQVKVQYSGRFNYRTTHQASVLNVSPRDGLWISRSVFSHFRERAWLMSNRETRRVEFVCNVIAKVLPDSGSDHSFHIFRHPGPFRFYRNFINESQGRLVIYMYRPGPGSSLDFVDNQILFDQERSTVANVGGEIPIRFIGNQVIGEAEALGGGNIVESSNNTVFETRAAAGIGPFPALPESWPIERL